jgi:hypothetical protein
MIRIRNQLFYHTESINQSFVATFLLQGFLLESPIHYNCFFVELRAIHFCNGRLRLFEIGILDKGITFGVACFAIHVEMKTFDFSIFAEGVKHVIFLYLFVKVGGNEYPSLDRCVSGGVHLRG